MEYALLFNVGELHPTEFGVKMLQELAYIKSNVDCACYCNVKKHWRHAIFIHVN